MIAGLVPAVTRAVWLKSAGKIEACYRPKRGATQSRPTPCGRALAARRSARKDLAARPAEIVLGHERDDRAGDLPAALRGRLDRIGEIVVLVTDKPKIDDRNARSGS